MESTEKSLLLQTKWKDDDHSETTITNSNLGSVDGEKGSYDKEIEYHDALKIRGENQTHRKV